MLMYHSMHEVRNVFPQRYSSDMYGKGNCQDVWLGLS